MKDLYGNKMPLMSHRGVKSTYPENTLGAYSDAIKAGFEAIELDVVISKNKTIYCSHNHDLERETDGFGYIPDLSDAEINSYFAIHPITGRKEKIPRLEDVLKKLPNTMYLNIEIKSKTLFEFAAAARTVNLIKMQNRERRSMISSFNPLILRAIRLLSRNIKTGFLIKSLSALRLYQLSGAENIHPRADIINKGLLDYCNKRQIKIIPWTVNTSPARAHILAQHISEMISDEKRLLSIGT